MPASNDIPMKPLIFGPRSVLAWQAHAKTQTRRLVKPQPDASDWCLRQLSDGRWRYGAHATEERIYWLAKVRQPYAVGDLLWIREALKRSVIPCACYVADNEFVYKGRIWARWPWKRNKLPAMFMPRWACRYYAKVVSVRPERLQEISVLDALAEGTMEKHGWVMPHYQGGEHDLYMKWWDSMHKKLGTRSEDNPWVWVYEIKEAADAEVVE